MMTLSGSPLAAAEPQRDQRNRDASGAGKRRSDIVEPNDRNGPLSRSRTCSEFGQGGVQSALLVMPMTAEL